MKESGGMSAADFEIIYQEFIRKYPQDRGKGDTSTRFRVIIELLKGLTDTDVAELLGITEGTIRQYRSRTCREFGVKDLIKLKQLFDRYQQIWNPEDESATVANIAEIGTQFNNLPIRHCSQPIGREGDIDRLLKSIPKYDVIWVKGIGGCGKTTTLLEVANRCLDGAEKFDAIIYISAQTEGISNNQRIGLAAQRNIVDIYRQIFNTFDCGELMYANIPGTEAELKHDYFNSYVCQLLQQYRTLLILDNFDTQENYEILRNFGGKSAGI
jgi:NB-ARC domain/Homeodomain-like domain